MVKFGAMLQSALYSFVLLLIQPAWAQVAGEAVPSRQFTWEELLVEEEWAALDDSAPVFLQPPDHGLVQTRRVPDPSPRPLNEQAPERTFPGPSEPLCPGFPSWPSHTGVFGFQGLGDNNAAIPPDTMGAVGPRHVMTMLNTQVKIDDRSGSLTYSTIGIGTFWAGLNGPFDPKIYYDNLSGRWIAVCLGNRRSVNSDWEIIISSTNDPTGSWTSYHFDGDAADTRWVDFPCVGFNDKWVAVTFNAFAVPGAPGTPVEGSKMWVFNKPQLLAGGAVGFIEYEVDFDVDSGFTMQPAVCMEANVDDLYILDSSGWVGDPGGNTNWLRMSRITGTPESPQWSAMPGSNTVKAGFFPVQYRFSNTLLPASQQGSPTGLDAGDARMCNVVYRNGRIWAVHGGGYPADAPDRNALYWYELLPSLPNPIVQSGVIETGGPDAHYIYPSIAVNCGNDACIGFSAVSPAIFASACYATRLAGDSPGTTSSTQYFKDGRAKYVKLDMNSRNRWGDYSATVVDPLDDKTFWTLQEYAELPFVLGPDAWAVQWAQITENCQSPVITQHPQSQAICLGQPVTFSVGVTGDVAQYQWNKGGQPIPGETFYDYTIPAVSADDAGQYSCTVIGLCSAVTSGPATLGLLTAPVVTGFVAWPNATCPGDVASIIPAVPDSGSFPMTVTLQKYNGAWQDVPGRTIPYGDTFVFSPLVHDDTGDYRLKYTNACGDAYTDQHRIQVGVSFDHSPAAESDLPCGSATFSVVARGVGTLTYQWRRDGAPLVDDARISGSMTPGLLIDGLLYEDEGSYDCEVTDDCETLASDGASLTLPTPTWQLRSPPSAPVARFWTSMAYDESREVCVLYGGELGPRWDDTWEWDGVAWTEKTPVDNPGRRSNIAMTYDTNAERILLWGCFNGEGTGPTFLGDLWAYDGDNWTLVNDELTGHGSPAPTSTPELVYDQTREKVVLVRNVSGTNNDSETYEYDAATDDWTLEVASNGFWAGYGTASVYDPQHNQTIHYYADGGFSGYRDTWRYDGNAWTKDAITTPRFPFGLLAYDALRRRSVLFFADFGGFNIFTPSYFDTGSDWVEFLGDGPPDSPPKTLACIGMAFDTHRRAMVAVFYDYLQIAGHPLLTYEYRYVDRVMFDRHPQAQPLTPGADVSFNVVAAGYGTLDYQWRRNGVDLIDGPALGGGTVSGANSPTLTLNAVQAPDGGIYTCEVSNGCGSELSDGALLGVALTGDLDGDGDVDIDDYVILMDCMSGPNVAYPIGCDLADLDFDGDVDLEDFTVFQGAFEG